MDEQNFSLSELMDQAAAASRLGDLEEAERLFRRATERSPANTRAWLGLAGAVQSPDEKRAHFEQVLALNPANGEARAALQRLAQRVDDREAEAIQSVLAETAAQVRPPQPAQPVAPEAELEHAHDHDLGSYDPVAAGEVLFCVNHPDTETTLRCYRCSKPVCTRCVERTPVGYLCTDCIRERRGIFYTAETTDYLIAALVSFILAAVAAPIIGFFLGFFGFFGWFFAFILGPTVGGTAATIIRRSVGRRRGQYMGIVAVFAIVLGVAASTFLLWLVFGLIPNILVLAIFGFLALSTIYASLR